MHTGEETTKSTKFQTAMEASMENIHATVTMIDKYQRYVYFEDSRGEYYAERLNYRVTMRSFIQTAVILITGIGQVYILKRFFSDNKSGPSGGGPVIPVKL